MRPADVEIVSSVMRSTSLAALAASLAMAMDLMEDAITPSISLISWYLRRWSNSAGSSCFRGGLDIGLPSRLGGLENGSLVDSWYESSSPSSCEVLPMDLFRSF